MFIERLVKLARMGRNNLLMQFIGYSIPNYLNSTKMTLPK